MEQLREQQLEFVQVELHVGLKLDLLGDAAKSLDSSSRTTSRIETSPPSRATGI